MMSRSLWRGFDPPTTRPLPRSRNRLKKSNVHYLFFVRNMFFLYLKDMFLRDAILGFMAAIRKTGAQVASAKALRCAPLWRFHSNQCTIHKSLSYVHVLWAHSHDRKTRSVSRRDLAGAPVTRR